ncbi:MAG: glutaminyl-peptide cyclotransferase [Planctomycetota bacterium]|jgi:glutaminyl-peptide cyclotransferase
MQSGSVRKKTRPTLALLAALSLVLALSVTSCGSSGPVSGSAAMAHVDAMLKLGPRPFGSDNLAKAADYICAEIDKIDGLKAERQEAEHAKEKKTIRNLYCQIDGEDPENGPILMIAAHYDTKLADGHSDTAHNIPFVGAIDGTGAPAVLIELARSLQNAKQKTKCNVWLYWIDAEESIDWTWNDDRALLGSDMFAKWMKKNGTMDRLKAFVLLDLIGSKDMKIDEDGNSVGSLLEIFGTAAKDMGESKRMYEFPTAGEKAEYQRRGINKWGTKDDHLNFSNYGIPTALLIDFSQRVPGQVSTGDRFVQWWHTEHDNRAAMDSDSLAFAGNLVMKAMPALDAFVTKKKGK